MSKFAILLLTIATTTASADLATPELKYFQYQRNLTRTSTAAGQSCLVLDPAIYSHAAPELADLRLYADDALETPYAIHKGEVTVYSNELHQPLNLGKVGGQTSFDVAMPTSGYTDVELTINAQDFLANVLVSGGKSSTDSNPTKLGSFTIFDLSKQRLGRSTVLHLPESNFPILHFRIQGPIDPDSVGGVTIDHAPLEKTNYTLVADSKQIKSANRTTTIEFDLPAHAPVDRIEFLVGPTPVNFNRDVQITAQEAAQKLSTGEEAQRQQEKSSASILRVHRVEQGQRIDEERLAFDAPFTNFARASHWTIEIANRDDQPLSLTSVRLLMQERQLCFDALANKNYTLYYGDSALSAPQYDYTQLFTWNPAALAVTSAPEHPNSIYQPRPDARPFTERHPALLWLVMILVVAVLGLVALKSAKPAPTDEE